MHPGTYLEARGEEPAVIMSSGAVVTYRELDARSKQLAQLLHDRGLRPGDHVAVMLENHPRYFEINWASQRSGLYLTPVNWHLKAEEAGYIIEDCGATALVISASVADITADLSPHLGNVKTRLVVDGELAGFEPYEDAIARYPPEPLAHERDGAWMFYSSGTTGRPKGIKPPLPTTDFGGAPPPIVALIQHRWGFSEDTVYLCPAPLYHAAPLGWSMSVQRLGGTVVVMERFDPAQTLELIERFHITHAQFVPTHFVRMLKLPEEERNSYDLSSLQAAIHAAAPCPVEVKEQMIAWWGPIIHEYYAGSEGNGFTAIEPEEWLAHKGSVGKPLMGAIHILNEEGTELPTGDAGQIWFESGVRFEYHNDAEKTAGAFNDQGWSSLGDVGYLDGEGYLYLTDRVSHMIIRGGVNIYPQEIENLLTMHPEVADVAVIGVPDPDLGEQVKAVVQPAHPSAAGGSLAQALIVHCHQRLAAYKCPTSVDFVDRLPRLPTGKLLKRELRGRYWSAPQ
jgi:long-chain acyl-CoA synthetase